MAASASDNSSATVACFLLLLLLALTVFVSAAGSTRGPAAAPAPSPLVELHEADDDVVVVQPVSTERRRCNSDKRWNDQLCRNVCGMFKFYGYEFNAPAAEASGEAPSCCCCPGGVTCLQL